MCTWVQRYKKEVKRSKFLLFFTTRNVKRCALAYATTKNAPFLNPLRVSLITSSYALTSSQPYRSGS